MKEETTGYPEETVVINLGLNPQESILHNWFEFNNSDVSSSQKIYLFTNSLSYFPSLWYTINDVFYEQRNEAAVV